MSENKFRMEITVESKYNFDDTVSKVEEESASRQFPVLYTHKVSEIIKSNGFESDPLTIVEICNSRLASQALKQDIRVAMIMPCPVVVYEKDGKVFVSTMDASKTFEAMYDGEVFTNIAREVDSILAEILVSIRK